MMTDPEAMKDPERLKAWRKAQHVQTRQRVLGSLRTNSLVMTALGLLAVAAGGVLAATAALAMPAVAGLPIVACLVPLGIGVVFVFFGRWIAPAPRSILRDGTPAIATVLEVRALDRNVGVKQPGLSATAGRVTALLRVVPEHGGSFDVEHREFILGSDLSYLKVGSTVPVRCSRHDPKKLAFDFGAA
jgi:hypothetical protein